MCCIEFRNESNIAHSMYDNAIVTRNVNIYKVLLSPHLRLTSTIYCNSTLFPIFTFISIRTNKRGFETQVFTHYTVRGNIHHTFTWYIKDGLYMSYLESVNH